jgi:hypothetical protein
MSRFASKLTLVVAAVTLTTLSTTESRACGHGGGGRGGFGVSFGGGGFNVHVGSRPSGGYGGGHGGGYGGGYRRPPVYTQPQVVHQPVYSQPIYSQPTEVQYAPTTVVAQQPSLPPQPQVAQPAQEIVGGSAEQSALDALAALGGDETGSAVPQFGPAGGGAAIAGLWTAVLPGENRVELQLNADGTFRWTANSRGKVSSFEGTYTVTGGSLVLIRSEDQQQLAGTWAVEANGSARFRLNGAQDAGLLFARG